MNSVASNSIVNLFKQTTKPRTKLFVQSIPPGFTEDEFKELIQNYLEEIDYFLFKPGKIIRDPYGHLIGLDNPNYGFAVINFKSHTDCPKFNREFNQMSLSDCYNLKSKLVIEFALMQDIPSISTGSSLPPSSSISFRDLPVYKEFLKTFPFAAKVEEDRLVTLSHSIDLDDSSFIDTQANSPSIGTSEMETRLSVLPSPSPISSPQVSYASLLAKAFGKNDSADAVTPLTEFIKKSGAAMELLPSARRVDEKRGRKDKKREEKKQENERKQQKRRESERKALKETERKSHRDAEKKSFKSRSQQQPQQQTQQQAAPLVGVPKILARKQPGLPDPVIQRSDPVPPPKVEAIPVQISEPSQLQYRSRGRTLSERSAEEPQRKPREAYIRPEDRIYPSKMEENTTNNDTAINSFKTAEIKPEAIIVEVKPVDIKPLTKTFEVDKSYESKPIEEMSVVKSTEMKPAVVRPVAIPAVVITEVKPVIVPVNVKPLDTTSEVKPVVNSSEVKPVVNSSEVKPAEVKQVFRSAAKSAQKPVTKEIKVNQAAEKPEVKQTEKPEVKQTAKTEVKQASKIVIRSASAEKPVPKNTEKTKVSHEVKPIEIKPEAIIVEMRSDEVTPAVETGIKSSDEVKPAKEPELRSAGKQAAKIKVKSAEKPLVKSGDTRPLAKKVQSQPDSPVEKQAAVQKPLKAKSPKPSQSQSRPLTPLETVSPVQPPPVKKVFTSSAKQRETQSN